jgi:hypothetical protein
MDLTADLRAKHSAPSIDPKCSAHAQVRALSPLPTGAVEDSSSTGHVPKLHRNTKQKTKRQRLSKQSPEDTETSHNYTEQSSGDEGEWEDESPSAIESQEPNQKTTEPTTLEVESSDLDNNSFYGEQYHDQSQLYFPSPPWFQNANHFGNEDVISMATANLGEIEYEELQRIYREKVW